MVSQKAIKNKKSIAVIILGIIVIGVAVFFTYGTLGKPSNASLTSETSKTETITLYVIPDWGGPGYDAFVLPNEITSNHPLGVSNGTPPTANNTIIVPVNTTVKFVIVNLDSMQFNWTGKVTIPFTIYNDTEDHRQVAINYTVGETIQNLPTGHTFTVPSLGINIPIPPYSIVVFYYTFTKAGTYLYLCETPCGPGMDYIGYMQGYIVVK